MKSKVWFFIIGIPVITLILVFALFALRVFWIYTDGFDRISIMYLVEKDTYRNIYIKKHSFAKFSKIKTGMTHDEVFKLVGIPTDVLGSGYPWYRYKIDTWWYINLSFGGVNQTLSEVQITDGRNDRVFELEYDKYSIPQPYLRAVGTFTGDGKPKHSLAKFSKIKIGMNPNEVLTLAGKPTDSLDSSFIWYRYKIDKDWYIDLHFFNEQLSDMSIVDYPNNRVFELEQEDYITTLPCPNTVAKTDDSSSTGTFTDVRDGKTYRTVKIGKLTWMAENLNFAADSSLCYNNDESNCQKYGRLYSWDAAMKVCPSGWRLSSNEDWLSLALAAAGKCNGRIHWNLAGIKLKSTTGWNSRHDGNSGNGTDDFGFSALSGEDSIFGAGSFGNWWSATERDARRAVYWSMIRFNSRLYRGDCHKIELYSVRCVREQISLNTTLP